MLVPFILSDLDYESELKRFKAMALLPHIPGELDWPTRQLKDFWNYDALFLLCGSGKVT